MKALKVFLVTSFLLIIDCTWSMAQCAMCQATVRSNLSEGRGVIGIGLNGGILFLLIMPYLSVSLLMFFWFRNARKNLAEKVALQQRMKEILG